MKRIIRCICLTLVFAMVLSTGAIAADATKQNESETVSFLVDNYDEAQIAQDTYANLSPEAKQLFDQLLARNPRLAEYHRNNVDSSFRADLTDTYAVPKPNDPLELLAAELAALALPASVEYSLEAMGAGMVAAVADGPLPVGDILLAASTASAAIVVAANWNLVSSKWSRIINAFTTAFSTMVSNVRDAFGEIKDEIPNIQSAPPISINGQEVTIGGEKYNCRTDAEYFSKRDVKKDTYYVALRYMKEILNERQYRCYLGKTAISLGRGGLTKVARLSGASVNTVRKGIAEVKEPPSGIEKMQIRRTGGGRKSASKKYPNIEQAIEEIIDGKTYGDPEKVIHWTTQSLMSIAEKLRTGYGIEVSHTVVAGELRKMGYSKQLNQKMLQVGKAHPDRNAQFEYINRTAKEYLSEGEPVLSIDCKKKENLGNFKNNGHEYCHKKSPRKVLDHDFLIKELGSVAPYGVYDVDKNIGFVNLGLSHDTAEFAVNSIMQWWLHIGKETYPHAKRIYINCDGGGSNGSRLHLWKAQIAKFAEATGLEVHVSHFPPGTSKWNKIEHRLFCYISKTWAGQPLVDIETVIDLIGSTTTKQGLKVKCVLDTNDYPTGIKVSNDDFSRIDMERIGPFHDWNYIIRGFKKP